MLSVSEENYLKAVYKISEHQGTPVSTNAIARELKTSAASVTDMIKKLAEKDLVHYQKYHGVSLTSEGIFSATQLIRKHRLWESFLVNKLSFTWDQVHLIAEQLEHIQSEMLVDKLDAYLQYPKFDPHGDPIPDKDGKFTFRKQFSLDQMEIGDIGIVVGVQNHDSNFLRFLKEFNLGLDSKIKIIDVFDFDGSMKVGVDDHAPCLISNPITKYVYVRKV